MFKKILVPLDGSELSEWALEPALALGMRCGGEVLLLRVLVAETMLAPALGELDGWPDQTFKRYCKEARDYLETIQQVRARPDFMLRARVIEGDAAAVIVETAEAEKVDLIAMSTHGYSGITRWMVGSVTEEVLRSAPCPVLVMRSPGPLRHILITLDGSELSQQALRPGLEIAASLGGEVTLLRAVPDVRIEVSEVERFERIERGLGRGLREGAYDYAQTYLKSLAAANRSRGLYIRTAMQIGPAVEGILKYVETNQIDLIVMSTRGRTGLRRQVLGSTTEKVLHGADCSMLIVPPTAHHLN